MLDNLIITADPTYTLVEAGTSVPISILSDFDLSDFSIQWNPSAYLSCDTCVQSISTPDQSIQYEIILTHESGCGATAYSNIELYNTCVDIFIPTHFSPNNDGLNDTWCVIGTCINRYLMRVYNEWGELIFLSESQSNCWDGTYLGVPVQMDSYSYQFEASLTNGSLVQLTGTVVVNP
jgi:gliding motility-associated-like protein